MLSYVIEGCTVSVVKINGDLYLSKNNDVTPETRELNPNPVLLPAQEKELREQGINFPEVWPGCEYLAVGSVLDFKDEEKWVVVAGGMSKTMAFGAANIHTVKKKDYGKWEEKEHGLYNGLRQGCFELKTLDEVKENCRVAMLGMNLYLNYIYCTQDQAMVVEFDATDLYSKIFKKKELKKKPLLRTNHYKGVCNESKPESDYPCLTFGRYEFMEKGLKKVKSIGDLMELMCSDPVNRHSISAQICNVETGEFWYSLKRPESVDDFQELTMKKA
jgi:hypothetical protein